MWRDICLANSDAILAELDDYQAQLSRLREMIAHGNSAALEAIFTNARNARNAWEQDFQNRKTQHNNNGNT
jgi:prephenate dehydrogenase